MPPPEPAGGRAAAAVPACGGRSSCGISCRSMPSSARLSWSGTGPPWSVAAAGRGRRPRPSRRSRRATSTGPSCSTPRRPMAFWGRVLPSSHCWSGSATEAGRAAEATRKRPEMTATAPTTRAPARRWTVWPTTCSWATTTRAWRCSSAKRRSSTPRTSSTPPSGTSTGRRSPATAETRRRGTTMMRPRRPRRWRRSCRRRCATSRPRRAAASSPGRTRSIIPSPDPSPTTPSAIPSMRSVWPHCSIPLICWTWSSARWRDGCRDVPR
mmetsp:Transcript_13917/g.40020  ORF Transcript_13917/g.40020 Transcript_13917/m.40020 type:complete len:268 (+) Transcript_13917:1156-1959(+)